MSLRQRVAGWLAEDWRDFKRKPLAPTFWLVSVALSLLVAYHDPFGLSTRLKVSLQAAFDPLVEAPYPQQEARHIALIMPTLADVAGGAVHFPIGYSELAQIVDVARLSHARAIFLDYRFSLAAPEGDRLSDLSRAVDEAEGEGVRVFTGPISDTDTMASLRKVVRQVDTHQEVDHPLDYPLAHRTLSGGRRPFAATALYEALCVGSSPLPECKADLLRLLEGKTAPSNLAMQFGVGFPQGETYYVPPDEVARCQPKAWLNLLQDGLAGRRADEPCERHLSIPASAVLQEAPRAQIVRDLQGRVVIVGQGPNLGDDHDWPGIGRLPGAVFHANALDNLLTWGVRYRRWPAAKFGPNVGDDDIVGLVLILGVPPVVLFIVRRLPKGPYPTEGKRRKIVAAALGLWAAAAILPALAALYFFQATNWAPACALTVLAVGAPLTTAVCGEELATILSPLNTPAMAIDLAIVSIGVLSFLAVPFLPAVVLGIGSIGIVAVRKGSGVRHWATQQPQRT